MNDISLVIHDLTMMKHTIGEIRYRKWTKGTFPTTKKICVCTYAEYHVSERRIENEWTQSAAKFSSWCLFEFGLGYCSRRVTQRKNKKSSAIDFSNISWMTLDLTDNYIGSDDGRLYDITQSNTDKVPWCHMERGLLSKTYQHIEGEPKCLPFYIHYS